MPKEEVDLAPIIEKFQEFFSTRYEVQISELANVYPSKKSLNVDYADLESFDGELADELLKKPDIIIEASEKAVMGMNRGMPEAVFEPHVRFFGVPDRGLLIQDIGSKNIESLIAVKGVITKRADVVHRVKIALYRCMMCDASFKVPVTKKYTPPQLCESCKRRSLRLEEDESYFVDLQKAEAQELLERLKGGTPAAHIELWLEDDLVNTLTPGDTVEIAGVMRIRPPIKFKGKQQQMTYTRFLDVLHCKRMQRDFEEIETSKEEEMQIRELSRDPQVFDKIKRSVAPAISGHDEVKEALVLQTFGGTPEKQLVGGGKIRDDIHILLIGDPGVAKTRFLQSIMVLAPKSIYVSGKSVTGVGLTASAEKDELGDGGWTLKAGALVLASGGIAAVDEFDKIDDNERGAMHEVMESQTVSIAKAGIVAQFKAKTAVLAAANPKLGRFDQNKLPGEQFDIPPSLLSRFDLIFPIIDIMDEEQDSRLADHILQSHKKAAMRKPNEVAPLSEADAIDTTVLRKYISYARKNIRPVISDEAMNKLKDFYVQLRKVGKQQGAVPITPRYIEGLIRMSEASAKVRLSDEVSGEDADRAIKLMNWVLDKIMRDRETGRYDSDIISTGRTKSQVDKINTITGLIRELAKEYDQIEVNKIVEEAKTFNIDEVATRRIIDELATKGEVYRVRHGFIKLVEQG
jgi:replicative DNA helicase Mcm